MDRGPAVSHFFTGFAHEDFVFEQFMLKKNKYNVMKSETYL